jgi:hypothetical protein
MGTFYLPPYHTDCILETFWIPLNMSNDWFYRYQTTILAVVLVFVPIVVICIIFITALSCSEYWSRRRGCSFSHFTCICGRKPRSHSRRNHSNTDDVDSSERAKSSRTSAENKNPVSGTELSPVRPVAVRVCSIGGTSTTYPLT